MNSPSLKLRTLLDELTNTGTIAKDHHFVAALEIEEKYELIKLESQNWLSIENGLIVLGAAYQREEKQAS